MEEEYLRDHPELRPFILSDVHSGDHLKIENVLRAIGKGQCLADRKEPWWAWF